jgi:F420-0:gamma-glutamyl ligase
MNNILQIKTLPKVPYIDNGDNIADIIIASAGLIMGQRGTNKPVVIISGFEFEFDDKSTILESLSRANLV